MTISAVRRVLSVASECVPLIKTGGLADVAGALPAALAPHGWQMRVLMPAYAGIGAKAGRSPVWQTDNLFGGPARVMALRHAGLEMLLLEAPHLYDRRGGPYLATDGYDHPDNPERFAALCWVAAEIARDGLSDGWRPEVVHAHDWQGALVPAYLTYGDIKVPSVLTIHNIAFQGQFSADLFPQLGLPGHALWEALEYYGTISYLKGGLVTAHAVSTVSPSYAEEILTPAFGMGLEGVITSRADDLYGIVNGIDATVWNPATDRLIAQTYAPTALKKRQANREALAARFMLDDDDGPIFCVISRLTWQKGMDLLAEVTDMLVATGAKLVVLGSGDHALESSLLAAAARHKGRIGMVVGYDEPLSHLMQAGADAILIPSRFEPCGLTQLYGLRYGCVPVVARTGGLADTIIDANEAAIAAQTATGIKFAPGSADALRSAIRRTVRLHTSVKIWGQLQKQGMKCDVSWGRSAERYAELYQRLVSKGQ